MYVSDDILTVLYHRKKNLLPNVALGQYRSYIRTYALYINKYIRLYNTYNSITFLLYSGPAS